MDVIHEAQIDTVGCGKEERDDVMPGNVIAKSHAGHVLVKPIEIARVNPRFGQIGIELIDRVI